jgi:hypothetical protein
MSDRYAIVAGFISLLLLADILAPLFKTSSVTQVLAYAVTIQLDGLAGPWERRITFFFAAFAIFCSNIF